MKKSTSILTDPFIYVEKNVLTKHRCNTLIKNFEEDPRKQQGVTGAGLDLLTKNSIDLNISWCADWKKHDSYIHPKLTKTISNYYEHLNNTIDGTSFTGTKPFKLVPPPNLKDTGYQIQKTEPGKGYIWHHDFVTKQIDNIQHTRHLTFIFYLNTVDEGWTQFYNGDQVAPETGSVCIFPATWSYVHQGFPPLQTKYIMTGWVWIEGEF